MNRRLFLKTSGVGVLSTIALKNSLLFGETKKEIATETPFHWARVKFDVEKGVPDKWDIHPDGDAYFLKMLKKYTNINVDETWHVANLGNIEEMKDYPFTFMTADGDFNCTEKQLLNLKEYLERGGFLFADDCVHGTSGDRFFKGFKSKIEKTFKTKMVKLPNNHDIYHNFYDLKNGLPHSQGVNHGGYGLYLNNRLSIFLSPSDLHCAWTTMSRNANENQRLWFPKETCYDALKMGINIVSYAMMN